MASDLISYLVEDRIAELEQQQTTTLARMVEDTVIARFPNAPISLAAAIWQVRNAQHLQALHAALLRVPDQAAAERLLQEG